MDDKNTSLQLEWVQSELDRIGFTEETEYAKAVKQLLVCLHDMSPGIANIRKELLSWVDLLHAGLPLTPITEEDQTYVDSAGMIRFSRSPRVFQNPNEDNKYFDDYAITFKDDEGNHFWTEKSTREVTLPYKVGTKIIRM
jgi:hypothetical protein